MAASPFKVFVTNPIHPDAVEWLRQKAAVVLWNDPAVDGWRENADAVIVRTTEVRRGDMERAARLRVIGKHGVGVDTIDLDAARSAGIAVVNTPRENVESVAELAVAFMLALSRNLRCGDAALRAGATLPADALLGTELLGKTLGVVGLGRIGQRVASILTAAFGMAVAAYDPFLPDPAWNEIPFAVRRCRNLEDLAEASDYVTIHVPLVDKTRGLIGEDLLRRFRPGAVLVNTARGGIVDEDALYRALRDGRLRAAASDVFVREPPDKEHPLLTLANFMATPHVGANTVEALLRMGLTVANDVVAVLNGEGAKYHVPGSH